MANYKLQNMHTFKSLGYEKLTSLCRVINFNGEQTISTLQVFSLMLNNWGDFTIDKQQIWTSDVTDDHTPFEFSLAFDGKQPAIRFVIESQTEKTSLDSSWVMGCKLNRDLQANYAISLDKFNIIEKLFEPRNSQALFSIWHAVDIKRFGKPVFKVYLNPEARGIENAPTLIKEALLRLGFAKAWDFLSQIIMQHSQRNRLLYFSLDLSSDKGSRIKVYVAHMNATANDVEKILAVSPHHIQGDAIKFCQQMAGQTGPFNARPLITCFAFTSDNETQPYSTTLHLPIRCYAENDNIAMQRISRFLPSGDAQMYQQAVASIAGRPLEAGVGIQTYVSFKRLAEQQILTIYLAPEAYGSTLQKQLSKSIKS